MSDSEPTVTVYADYVCPFCYLGHLSLEEYRRRRERDLAVDWHPFDLQSRQRGPDGELDRSVDDGKDEEYFEQVRQNVERLRTEYGAEEMLGIDEVAEVDSMPAQVASQFVQAEHPDKWPDFHDAVYRAHWVEGKDVEHLDVLADLAADVGVPPGEVREAVDDDERRSRVFEAFEAARRRGVTGVPTFVAGDRSARGAVPPDHLARLVDGT